jgi:hypothetical protein
MVFSTLEGRTPGRAFVDDLEHPTRCLLVINFYHLSFIGGVPDQHWLDQTVAELRRGQDVNLTWSPQIAARLTPPATPAAETARFEFYARAPAPPMPIPDGHQIQRIDGELFARCAWRDEMLLSFGTAENYLRHGIGLCLTTGDEIRCEAYAVYRGAGMFEIGAVTHEGYRQRGYALLTCQHLVHICEARGWPTYWSCNQENAASAATARKLGYRVQRAYQFLDYPEVA